MNYRNPIHRPYVVPPSSTGRFVRNYERKIVYALQMRGDDDDIPYIIYAGAPYALIKDVYDSLVPLLGKNLWNLRIYDEHACVYRYGKAYRRVAVGFYGLQEHLLPLKEFLQIVNRKMQSLCWCQVSEIPLKKILNI